MLRIDLKALLQISLSTPGAFQMHKRIQLTSHVSYMVCFVVLDGQLTIKQARRLKAGRSSGHKVLPHSNTTVVSSLQQTLHDASSQTLQRTLQVTSSQTLQQTLQDASSQTWQREQSDARLDTKDLSQQINRQQQTTVRNYVTTGQQTKQLQLHAKATQTQPEKMFNVVASTQTEVALKCRNSCAQTTLLEDEQTLLSPHLELLQLLLRSSSGQGQLLMQGVEAINQLVEFKALELQKQRLLAKQDESTAEVKQLYSKSTARWCCAKIRSRPKRSHRRRSQRQHRGQTPIKLDRGMQSEPKSTACKWTQAEQLQTKVAANLVAATQTDKDKGFLWLRRSN